MTTNNYIEVAVLMAVHNRFAMTKNCIESLVQYVPRNWNLTFIIVNDGSTDATAQYLEELNMRKIIVEGPGTWFWAKSMAEAHTYVSDDFDFTLLINNDVEILPEALNRAVWRKPPKDAVIVGQLRGLTYKRLSYGGLRRKGRHPLRFELIEAKSEKTEVDCFHGNFVLIPREVVTAVGRIDGNYAHAYADFDYSMRVREKGYPIFVIPGFVGVCEPNIFALPSKSPIQRVKNMNSVKRTPFKSQFIYLKRYGGFEWPIYLIYPYIREFLGIKQISGK